MKTQLLITAALFAVLPLAGCGTLTGGSRRSVSLTSEPTGAQVTIVNASGKTVFTDVTPCKAKLCPGAGYFRGATYTVTFAKPGYRSASQDIKQLLLRRPDRLAGRRSAHRRHVDAGAQLQRRTRPAGVVVRRGRQRPEDHLQGRGTAESRVASAAGEVRPGGDQTTRERIDSTAPGAKDPASVGDRCPLRPSEFLHFGDSGAQSPRIILLSGGIPGGRMCP